MEIEREGASTITVNNNAAKISMGKNAADLSSASVRRLLSDLTREELIEKVMTLTVSTDKVMSIDERLQKQQNEALRRENILLMRLATKEQEVQDYLSQVEELRSSLGSGLRNSLLDPVVNSIFMKMRDETRSNKEKLEQSRQDLDAWKFTPDSNTGKRLMAKCRRLHKENEELGSMVDTGTLARLEGELGMARTLTEQLKGGQSEVDDLLLELDEDMEGLQTTVMFLQQQLEATRQENRRLRTLLHLGSEEPLPDSPSSPHPAPVAAVSKTNGSAAVEDGGRQHDDDNNGNSGARVDPTTGDYLPSSPPAKMIPETEDDGLMAPVPKKSRVMSRTPNGRLSAAMVQDG